MTGRDLARRGDARANLIVLGDSDGERSGPSGSR